MRKLLHITLLLLCSGVNAHAQTNHNGISITDIETQITGESLDLKFKVIASGLNMTSDGYTKVEFAVENSDRKLILPVVIYCGTSRYHYELRRQELSDAYSLKPYHIYKGVKQNRVYELDYEVSIPYYTWMEHASITHTEYTRGCEGVDKVSEGVLIADLNPKPVYIEPEIWKPRPELFPNLVSFLIPQVEEVKARASMLSLNIGFPVNVTEVRPSFGNNQAELMRADSLVSVLQNNDLLNINSVNIRGYASPEGKYSVNERLARERSQSFKQYLVKNYPDNQFVRNANTSWIPEDWKGFGKLVEQCDNIANKQEVLAIVYDDEIAPDTKDILLQKIVWWSRNYKVILTEMYPKLRRIELRVDYTISNLSDNDARELLYTNPDMLSLDEIYRVARYYEPGSRQYREVYEIAARQYSDDIVANNNAAAALLQEGNAEEALSYLKKIGERDESLINHGAYYYITGDLEKAIEYFEKAKQAGIEQAVYNLDLVGAKNTVNANTVN